MILSSRWARYVVAVLATALALSLKWAITPAILPGPLLPFYGAVVVASWFGGLGPGVLATLAAAAITSYPGLVPTLSPAPSGTMLLLRQGLFVALGIVWSLITSHFSRLQGELEARVAERTADLSSANLRLHREIADRWQAEERFRSAFEHAPIGMALVSLDGRSLRVNEAMCSMLGYTEEELLRKPLHEVVHPDDLEAAVRDGGRSLAGEVPSYQAERRYLHKSGRIVQVQVNTSPVRDPDGNAHLIITQLQDITERKRAVEMLALQGHVLDSMVEAVNLVDLSGIIRFPNAAFETMFGYQRGELTDQHVSVLSPDPSEETQQVVAAIVKRIETSGMWVGEFRNRKKDGTEFITFARISTLTVAGETYWLTLQHDITERKQAEAALRESEERFQHAFYATPVGMALFGLDGFPLQVNQAVADMLGYSPDEFLRKSIFEVTHPEDLEVGDSERSRLLTGEIQSYQAERRYFHKSGRIVWAQIDLSLVRAPDGTPLYLVAQAQDITLRKRAEDALRESEERFHNAFQYAPIGMALVGLDRHFLRINRVLSDILGYSEGELLAVPITDLIHPDDLASAVEDGNRVAAAAMDSYHAERCYLHKTGRAIPVRVSVSLVRDRARQPLYYVFELEDITEQKRAEEMEWETQHTSEVVSDILRALNAHLDVEHAFPTVAGGLRSLTGCEFSGLALFDHDERAAIVALDPAPAERDPAVRLRMSELPAATDALAGRPHVVTDLAVGLDSPIVRRLYEQGYRSSLSLPLRDSDGISGMLSLLWRRHGGGDTAQLPLLSQIADAVALAVQKTRLFKQVDTARARLQALSRRLMEVQETERQHIARELHDEIGQHLTGLKLLLGSLERLPAERALEQLAEAHQLIDDLVGRVRDLSLDLRPAMLDDLGLLPAYLWLFRRYTGQTDVRVNFTHTGLEQRFSQEVETAAYRIVQEALTNVARYARVNEVAVNASVHDGTLELRVNDDGAGFDCEPVLSGHLTGGLAGIRERVSLLGGRITVESALGAGTRLRAELPLRRSQE